MSKKIFALESLGCAKNQVDSEYIINCLLEKDWEYKEDPSSAEIIIINTCGFINPAKEESINRILEIRTRYPDKKIIAAGCLVRRYLSVLKKEMREQEIPEGYDRQIDELLAGVRIPDSHLLGFRRRPVSFTEEKLKEELRTLEDDAKFLKELKERYGEDVQESVEETLEKVKAEEDEYRSYATQAIKEEQGKEEGKEGVCTHDGNDP